MWGQGLWEIPGIRVISVCEVLQAQSVYSSSHTVHVCEVL